MYVPKLKKITTNLVSVCLFPISCFLLATGVMGIIASFGGDRAFTEDIEVFFVMIGFAAMIFMPAYIMRRNLGAAHRFNNFFSMDTDGIVPISEAAVSLGMSEEAVIQRFQELRRKEYLLNCRLVMEPVPQIILGIGKDQAVQEILVKVSCPGCGAPAEVQRGFIVTCEYCGTKIRAK